MRKIWAALMIAGATVLGASALPAGAQSGSAPALDLSSIGRSDPALAPVEDVEKGDGKTFTFKTEGSLELLKKGAIYKPAVTRDRVQFTVKDFAPNGTSGGTIIFERTAGTKGDIPDDLAKVQGDGPPTLKKYMTVIDTLMAGGGVMYIIAFLAFAMLVLGVNGLWLYLPARQLPAAFIEQSRKFLKNGNVKAFRELALNTRGLLPQICRAMTEDFRDSTIDDMKERTQVVAAARVTSLRAPIKLLNLISVAAPLVGLLGTIYGMMIVFRGVAGAEGAEKASILAAGINMKLVCTAAALCIAIPALALFFLYNSMLSGIIARCEIISDQFLHRLAMVKRAGGDGEEAEESRVVAKPAPRPAKAPVVEEDDDEMEEVVVVRKKKKARPVEEEDA